MVKGFNRFLVVMLILLVAIFGWLMYSLDRAADEARNGSPEIGAAIQCRNIQPEDSQINILIAQGFDVDYENNIWYIGDIPVGYAAAEDEPFALCADVELMNKWFGN